MLLILFVFLFTIRKQLLTTNGPKDFIRGDHFGLWNVIFFLFLDKIVLFFFLLKLKEDYEQTE